MARGLTDKQREFAYKYVELGGNQSAAYRAAYDCERMKPMTITCRASELMKNSNVADMIAELQKRAQKRAERKHDVTLDTLLVELEEARTVALSGEKPQAAAAVSATMGKAKLVGLDKQVLEVTGELSVRRTLDDFYGDA